jgi:hypothetical protein
MKLVEQIAKAMREQYETDENILFYIYKWQTYAIDDYGDRCNENFHIFMEDEWHFNLLKTLHGMDSEILLQIATDLGLETPDFLPSIPIFRNEIKSSYQTAHATFEKAIKNIENHPADAISFANSALESIVKEILKSGCFEHTPKKTLYDLTISILKAFQMFPNSGIPVEIKNIGSSLLTIAQNIESLRSNKTDAHGKTDDDYIVNEPMHAYFVVNSVATVGLFLKSFYTQKFQHLKEVSTETSDLDEEIPF